MRCYQFRCEGWDRDTACQHDPWRRLTPDDLSLSPSTPVRINGKIKGTIGSHADLRLPGNYPFLIGMQAFIDIEVPDERFALGPEPAPVPVPAT